MFIFERPKDSSDWWKEHDRRRAWRIVFVLAAAFAVLVYFHGW
jgi:hypothetical protein